MQKSILQFITKIRSWKFAILFSFPLIACSSGGISSAPEATVNQQGSSLGGPPQINVGGPVGGAPAAASGPLSASTDPQCMDGTCFFMAAMRVYYGYSSPSELLDLNVEPVPPPPTLKVMSTEPFMDYSLLLQKSSFTKESLDWDSNVDDGYLAIVVELDGRHLCSYHTMTGKAATDNFNAKFLRVPLGAGEKIQMLYYRVYTKNPAYKPEDIDSTEPKFLLQKPPETCSEDKLSAFKNEEDYGKFVAKQSGVLDLGTVNIDYMKIEKAKRDFGIDAVRVPAAPTH